MTKTAVFKFGGAAVAKPECFHQIAQIVLKEQQVVDRVVVVVSAMQGMTDQLFTLAKKVHPNPPKRENDMLVSVGERVSGALLAMALERLGAEAVSFTGSQAGIVTTSSHGDAEIVSVRPERLEKNLEKGRIVIVAGFQGVSEEKEITTLGRGGSDTTAVAIAAALGVEKVTFFKDVCGIYSSDPKTDLHAKPKPYLTYNEAASIVNSGAQILHAKSLALAEKKQIALHVRSFLHPKHQGTYVGPEFCCINHHREC